MSYTSNYIKTPLVTIGDCYIMIRKNRTKFAKTECLKEIRTKYAYMNNALKSTFVWAFDDEITCSLPKGDISFLLGKYDEETASSILKEYKNFYYFIDGASNMTSIQKETYFTKMVTKFNESDRELMIALKDKNVAYKYRISKEIVSSVFPEIQWGGRIKQDIRKISSKKDGFDPSVVQNIPTSNNSNLQELEQIYSGVY